MQTVIKLKLILVILIFKTPFVFSSEYQFIGDIKTYAQQENIIKVECDNANIEITILADDLFRIKMYPGNKIPLTNSYAVVPLKKSPTIHPIEDLGEQLRITTNELILNIQKSPCRLAFLDLEGNIICKDHDDYGMGWNGANIHCWKELHDESFYGLGEKTRGFNKRGNVYTMWNSDIPGYTPTTDPIYQTHPFFISLFKERAFAIFFDNSYRSQFNLGAGNNQFYRFGADDGVLDYYFFYGPGLKKVLKRYGELVGNMPLPPKWSLGYQQCRWSYYPEKEVMELANTFRDKEIPCDVIYLDIHYMDGYRCFTWHPDRFPSPKKMLRNLKEMGFKVVVIIDPGIKVDSDYWVYQQGVNGDFFCKYPNGNYYEGQVWPGWCCFPDFSKAGTRLWWGNLYKNIIDDGIMGFWNDMNEPATWGGTFPDIVQFHDDGHGASHLKMHNLYGFLMAKSTYEGVKKNRPGQRPFVLTRAGYAGVQRYSAVWTGDNVASWEHLQLSIRMCLGLSMSGVSFCGPDIGGFMGAPTPELFTRWIQLGVFTPLFRTHTCFNTPDQKPWSFGDDYEAINKKFLQLRYELMPYIYDAFYQSAITNIPIMRPLVLEYQQDQNTINMDNQYMFGEDLLIAPVCEKNQHARKVYFPGGEWYDFWNGEIITGPREKWVNAPLDKIPVFTKAGAIIPMQQPVNYIGEKEINPLILHIYPKQGISTDSLYEDDGISFDFKNGDYCITAYELNVTSQETIFTTYNRIGNFSPSTRSYLLYFYNIPKIPTIIKLDGQVQSLVSSFNQVNESKSGWYYDEQRKCLYIKYPDMATEMKLSIR